jgi:hypothetical protein
MVNFDRRLQHKLNKSRLASVNVCLTYIDVEMVSRISLLM